MNTTRQDELQGKRVRITFTSNRFASGDVGKTGIVTGHAPLEMVIVTLDDGREYWANPSNLATV